MRRRRRRRRRKYRSVCCDTILVRLALKVL
jgi:hypothetical protein